MLTLRLSYSLLHHSRALSTLPTRTMALPQPTLLPPVHRGMTVLDREAFRTKVPLLAARLPASKTTGFLKEDGKECVPLTFLRERTNLILASFPLYSIILRLRGVASVAPDSSEQHRQVLLRTRDKCAFSVPSLAFDSGSHPRFSFLPSPPHSPALAKGPRYSRQERRRARRGIDRGRLRLLDVWYAFSPCLPLPSFLALADSGPSPPVDQVLQAILPEDLLDESPTAFTQCGHIGAASLFSLPTPFRS